MHTDNSIHKTGQMRVHDIYRGERSHKEIQEKDHCITLCSGKGKINPTIFVNRRKIKCRIFGNMHQIYDFSSWGYNMDVFFVLQNLPNSTNGQADFAHLPSIFVKLSQAVRDSKRQKVILKKNRGWCVLL